MDYTSLLIGLLAAGGVVFLLMRANTRQGVRTVRAYLFLKAREAGASVDEARAASRIDPKNIPERHIHDTMLYLQKHHRGRQAPLIKAAESVGFMD